MSGIGLSVAEVQRWSAAAVREVFHVGQGRAEAALDAANGLAALDVFDNWGGDTANAARTAISRTRMDLDAHGEEAMAVAYAAKTAAEDIEVVQRKLRALIDEAHEHGLVVNEVTSKIEFAKTITNPTDALIYRLDLQPRLNAILAEADAVDDALADAVNMADGDAPIPAFSGPPRKAEGRLANQIEAFTEVFGRRPSSTADWSTAAQLDPHSYDPKNHGVTPNIAVGRIKPIPGQGVVRANLFIPSESVKDPVLNRRIFDDNAGDNRGFNPAAGPESSRVALEVDYENGVVVARQNPSVNLTTGQVKAGSPTVRVAQRRDGTVYIDYAAADPFSPGGEAVAKKTFCVQGRLAVQPGAETPRVTGAVTAFPALEVYHDRPVGNGVDVPSTSTLAQMWPTFTGEWGPELGLPRVTRVGDSHLPWPLGALAGLTAPFPATTTELGPAWKPPVVAVVNGS